MLTFQDSVALALVEARPDTPAPEQVEAAYAEAREEAGRVLALLYLRGLAVAPAVTTETMMKACEAFLAAYGSPLPLGADPPPWVMRCVYAVLEAIHERSERRHE